MHRLTCLFIVLFIAVLVNGCVKRTVRNCRPPLTIITPEQTREFDRFYRDYSEGELPVFPQLSKEETPILPPVVTLI
jgi:hypothetical protein